MKHAQVPTIPSSLGQLFGVTIALLALTLHVTLARPSELGTARRLPPGTEPLT
jgi:hypothetical protein